MPSTATIEARVLEDRDASLHVDDSLGPGEPVAFPALHPFPFNVGPAVAFVWHRRPPRPGAGVADPRRRAGVGPALDSSAAPLCGLETRSFLGLVGHNDLELCAFCSKTFVQRTPGRSWLHIGKTASAHGFDTGFIPMSIVFPNSEISQEGGLHGRADPERSPGTRVGATHSFLWFERIRRRSGYTCSQTNC